MESHLNHCVKVLMCVHSSSAQEHIEIMFVCITGMFMSKNLMNFDGNIIVKFYHVLGFIASYEVAIAMIHFIDPDFVGVRV